MTFMRYKSKSPLRLAAIVCLQLMLSSLATAAPTLDLWAFWNHSATEESTATVVDHALWQSILDEYLVTDDPSGINLFQYAKLASDTASAKLALDTLKQYVASLEAIDPRTLSKAEQFAYWVNLYNAVTVRVIVDAYPVSSIRKTGKGLFSFGPWDDELVTIAGQDVSLNDIEHRILRPIWQDSRIHFVVNCASKGCPNLPEFALTADNTQATLEQARTAFINHPRGVSVKDEVVTLSSIFDWYATDFGDNRNAVLEYLSTYLKGQDAAAIQQTLQQTIQAPDAKIEYQYDWSLNLAK